MKKSELESHQASYADLMNRAFDAERVGDLALALSQAVEALEFVHGMMQYEIKYEGKEFDSVKAIEMIFRIAPLLLHTQALDAVEALLRARRQVEKKTEKSLADSLAAARQRLSDHHRLWDFVERRNEVHEDEFMWFLDGNQSYWKTTAESWSRIGIFTKATGKKGFRFRLTTDMSEVIIGKCVLCGTKTSKSKTEFLQSGPCGKCGKQSLFVMLAANAKI